MLNDMSLRIRIVLMTILAIFLPLIASDLYVFKREVDEWYDINVNSLYSSSAHISQDIDRWLNSKKSLARHIAESSLVRDFCTKYANSKLSKQEKDKLVKDFYNKAGTSAFLSTDIAELAISDLGECVPEDKLEKYIDNLSDRHVMNLNGNSPAEVAKKIVGGRGYGRPQYIGGNIFYSTSKEDIGMSWMDSALGDLTGAAVLGVVSLLKDDSVYDQVHLLLDTSCDLMSKPTRHNLIEILLVGCWSCSCTGSCGNSDNW